jgi:hypothetical protein
MNQSAAAGPGGATRNTDDLPDRPGNLADSNREHNAAPGADHGDVVPPSGMLICRFSPDMQGRNNPNFARRA